MRNIYGIFLCEKINKDLGTTNVLIKHEGGLLVGESEVVRIIPWS